MEKSKILSTNDDKGEDFLDNTIEKRTPIKIDQFFYDKKNETYYIFNFEKGLKNSSKITPETDLIIDKLQKNKNVLYFDISFNKEGQVNVFTHNRNKNLPKEIEKDFIKKSKYDYNSFSKMYRSFSIRFMKSLNSFKEAQSFYEKSNKSFNPNFEYIKSKKEGFEFSNYMLQGDQTIFFNVDDIYINKRGEIKLIELLNCSGKQIIGPLESHPNKYIGKNVNKFLSIYQLAVDLKAAVILLNYAESDSKFSDEIKLMVHESEDKIINTYNILKNTNYNFKNPNKLVFKFDKEIPTTKEEIKIKLNYFINKSNNIKNRNKI